MHATPSTARLSTLTRLISFVLNAGLGLIPSFAFFLWIERNCSLPRFGPQFDASGGYGGASWTHSFRWPWIHFYEAGTIGQLLWNAFAFSIFAFFHSYLAQESAQRKLRALIAPQLVRTFYVSVTGLLLLFVMGTWQNTGVLLWVAPLSRESLNTVSSLIYWILLGVSFWIGMGFDGLEFVGLKQLYQSDIEMSRSKNEYRLRNTGIYGVVRHPLYLFTLLAIAATPIMSLDRLWLLLLIAAYLAFAIPIEERKLVAQFGDAYLEYRRRVPAVIPGLKGR